MVLIPVVASSHEETRLRNEVQPAGGVTLGAEVAPEADAGRVEVAGEVLPEGATVAAEGPRHKGSPAVIQRDANSETTICCKHELSQGGY
jgi:hypothetical protein